MTNVTTGAAGRPARAGHAMGHLVTGPSPCDGRLDQAVPVNPLSGLQEIQHEYDELQVEGQMFQQQDNQKEIKKPRSARAQEQRGMDDHGTRNCWRNPHLQ
jgi:hypothetical protein